MFSNNLKLDGIENILDEIGYLSEEAKDENAAGEDQEHKYPKKSGKKSKDYDKDGTVEDETDEYAGVKDKAIEKAVEKEDEKKEKEGKEKEKEKKESVDFSSVLDELTEEDLLFLSDDLIEEVVEEFFYETLEEGFEIDELETILLEQVESELTYLEEAKVTVGHDSDVKPEASRTSKLAKVKDAVKKVASGAKAVAKKVAGAAGEVAGSAVAGYKKASAAAKDAPGEESDNSKSDSPNTGSRTPRSSSASATKATGTNRPGILGRVGAALKSGLKKAIHGAGKAAGKVVKTAKAGYDEGRGKSAPAPAPAAKPTAAAKPAAKKPATSAAKTATAKKKAGGNLDNLLNQIRNEAAYSKKEDEKDTRMVVTKADKTGNTKAYQNYKAGHKGYKAADHLDEEGKMQGGGKDPCWKGYQMVGMKKKGGREVPNCVPKEEYLDIERDMLEEGYTFEQVLEVIAAYEDGFEVIFEEDGVTINETQEVLDEETQFLSDVELVADWLHAEGVIENEDEFFELMEDLSEEEIEELYELVLSELYKGKHGQSETEYQDSRSNAGKMVSGTSKLSGAAYSSRGVKNSGPNPAGGSKKPQGQGRMTSGQRTEMQYRKANLKKAEGYEMIGTSLEEGGLEVRNYSWKEVMEAQQARNNPEKYEAEQKKKYAPVRGEKTPMPPRGDKRREDFEKWYAANVR